VKKWELLAYQLKDLRVPLVVRVPQVGTTGVRLLLNRLKICQIAFQAFTLTTIQSNFYFFNTYYNNKLFQDMKLLAFRVNNP